ncbi:MAG: hypothetical protein FJX80_06070 [Bacteroidetes bacterium]|nr:hypothetical protein [Bacteroidota bacterium]
MDTTENKTNDLINETLTQTKSVFTKFFDTVDNIDRKLYGRRMKFVIWGSLLVLIIAPLLDELFELFNVRGNKFTFYSTLVFFFFLVVLVLAFVGSLRDETGNWSLRRVKSRLKTYSETLKDIVETNRTSSLDEKLFTIGQFFFFGGIVWKALQNISVFFRILIEGLFSIRFNLLRKFEVFTNHFYWFPIIVGVGVIFYLCNKNPQILKRIKIELRQLFGWGSDKQTKYSNEIVKVEMNPTNELVINAKTEQQINSIKSASNSTLFNDFATALQNWNPRGASYEYEYQDRLYRHLRKNLPDAKIELEYPIGDSAIGNKGRADIVINDTILIEMKSDSSAGAVQRATGQIHQYSAIWKNKGPVILLLCDYDFEHARISFASTMSDLVKLNRPVMTIVAKAK